MVVLFLFGVLPDRASLIAFISLLRRVGHYQMVDSPISRQIYVVIKGLVVDFHSML